MSYSSSEFARLIAVLIESEDAKRALIKFGKSLDEKYPQRRENMDAFWVGTIQPLFNDESVQFSLDVRGCVRSDEDMEAIDVNAAEKCLRNGVSFRETFVGVPTNFTRAYHNWGVFE